MKIEHNSQSEFYKKPYGAVKDNQSIRIRLGIEGAGIPESIKLVYCDKKKCDHYLDMAYIENIGGICIYESVIPEQNVVGNIWYYFEISANGEKVFYGNNPEMLGGVGCVYQNKPDKAYQITVYDKDYKTPEWWKKSVCYQIFCDRFYNANPNGEILGNRQDIIKRNWGDTPYYKNEQFGGEYLSNDFFGGNLKGIEEKLPYLKELGISALYLNPIFKAYSNHKYDTGDYKQIDETFGTEKDFERLCKKAEKLGIKIVLDGVFNHTGSDSKYFNKNGTYDSIGAYQSKESPYYDWYSFTEDGKYESWWGILTLPQVREDSKSYQDYILKDEDSVVKHWIKKGASGWRLDVVDELPGYFVKILRREVKRQDPDAVIIGEVWEDASNKMSYGEEREYFLGQELDSVMNYPLKDSLIHMSLGYIDVEEFDRKYQSIKENYPKESFYSLLNFLSSHDVERILTVVSGGPDRRCVNKEFQANYHIPDIDLAKKKVKQLVLMQMTLPGVPSIFYGDEAGITGYGDPFCRACYPWGKEDEDMREFYRFAIALRKSSPAFVQGKIETVYKIGKVYGYLRSFGDEKRIIISNFENQDFEIRLDLARFGIKKISAEFCSEEQTRNDGIFYLKIPSNQTVIFKAI